MKPLSLDRLKIPDIGLADVRAIVEIGKTPPEGRERVKSGSTDCDEIQRDHHGQRGDLAVSASVRPVTECGEWIRSVGRIHIVARGNGVLRRIWRIALLAAGQRIVLVVIVAHQRNHRV